MSIIKEEYLSLELLKGSLIYQYVSEKGKDLPCFCYSEPLNVAGKRNNILFMLGGNLLNSLLNITNKLLNKKSLVFKKKYSMLYKANSDEHQGIVEINAFYLYLKKYNILQNREEFNNTEEEDLVILFNNNMQEFNEFFEDEIVNPGIEGEVLRSLAQMTEYHIDEAYGYKILPNGTTLLLIRQGTTTPVPIMSKIIDYNDNDKVISIHNELEYPEYMYENQYLLESKILVVPTDNVLDKLNDVNFQITLKNNYKYMYNMLLNTKSSDNINITNNTLIVKDALNNEHYKIFFTSGFNSMDVVGDVISDFDIELLD